MTLVESIGRPGRGVAYLIAAAALFVGCAESDTTGGPIAGSRGAGGGLDAGDATGDDAAGQGGGASEAGVDASDDGALADAAGEAATADAASNDGATASDAGESAICKAYCDCMATTCPGYLQGDCPTACAALTLPTASCRLDHCQNAGSDPATHCPHAIGIGYCQ